MPLNGIKSALNASVVTIRTDPALEPRHQMGLLDPVVRSIHRGKKHPES